MSFWDNVKKFAQPYSDDEYDDYDEKTITSMITKSPLRLPLLPLPAAKSAALLPLL